MNLGVKTEYQKMWLMSNQEVLVIYWQECFEANKKTYSDAGSVPWNLRACSFSFISNIVNLPLVSALLSQEFICVPLEKYNPEHLS